MVEINDELHITWQFKLISTFVIARYIIIFSRRNWISWKYSTTFNILSCSIWTMEPIFGRYCVTKERKFYRILIIARLKWNWLSFLSSTQAMVFKWNSNKMIIRDKFFFAQSGVRNKCIHLQQCCANILTNKQFK